MEINSQVKKDGQDNQASKTSRYRDVLELIIANPPKNVNIEDWDGHGDLRFSISMTDIGLQYEDYRTYENEIFSYFIIDFLGELIIRENLPLFVDKLQEYDINDYMMVIEENGHIRFGFKTYKGRLYFKFHVSLLKNILTEDLREILGTEE